MPEDISRLDIIMAQRTNEIRNDKFYRTRLALRDQSDYSNEPPDPLELRVKALEDLLGQQWTGKQWDFIEQLHRRVLHLENIVMELKSKKSSKYKKYAKEDTPSPPPY